MMQSVRNLLSPEKCARQLLKMPRQLVNREELGKLIARTGGAISMINESNYRVRSKSGYNTYTVIATNLDGVVRVPIMLVTMPSASMYMQSNFIAV